MFASPRQDKVQAKKKNADKKPKIRKNIPVVSNSPVAKLPAKCQKETWRLFCLSLQSLGIERIKITDIAGNEQPAHILRLISSDEGHDLSIHCTKNAECRLVEVSIPTKEILVNFSWGEEDDIYIRILTNETGEVLMQTTRDKITPKITTLQQFHRISLWEVDCKEVQQEYDAFTLENGLFLRKVKSAHDLNALDKREKNLILRDWVGYTRGIVLIFTNSGRYRNYQRLQDGHWYECYKDKRVYQKHLCYPVALGSEG